MMITLAAATSVDQVAAAVRKTEKAGKKTCAITPAPIPAPTPAPVVPTPEPTDVPSDTPTVQATFSPNADTSRVVFGIAAPQGGSPARTEDISTVAEFEEVFDAAMNIVLGVPSLSSYVVETSAIQYAKSNLVCTEFFTAVN